MASPSEVIVLRYPDAGRSGESPKPRTRGEHFSGGYLSQVWSDRRFVAFGNERQKQSVVNENHQRANPQC